MKKEQRNILNQNREHFTTIMQRVKLDNSNVAFSDLIGRKARISDVYELVTARSRGLVWWMCCIIWTYLKKNTCRHLNKKKKQLTRCYFATLYWKVFRESLQDFALLGFLVTWPDWVVLLNTRGRTRRRWGEDEWGRVAELICLEWSHSVKRLS